MQITFFGVRGSLPVPGPGTLKYGGNTTCLLVEFSSGEFLIIDAGTGLRELGIRMSGSKGDIHMLLTHNHWDHVMGFPFFKPAYQPGRKIHLYCHWPHDGSVPSLLAQMRYPFFPVSHEALRSQLISNPVELGQSFEPFHGVKVGTIALNHPDNGCGFRIEADGKCFVFITDNELHPPGKPITPYEDWVSFAKDSDLLVHDANYRNDEMASKSGWGHSSFEQAVELARDAQVKQLSLFHHDTERTDEQLDAMEQEAIELAEGTFNVSMAREMETIQL